MLPSMLADPVSTVSQIRSLSRILAAFSAGLFETAELATVLRREW